MKPLALSLLAGLLMAAAPASQAQGFSETVAATAAYSPDVSEAHTLDDGQVALLLRDEARDWDGTPYRYGGATRAGIDCSALMQIWFEDLFGQALPRTSDEQFTAGEPVPIEDLRPGDLVFFGSSRSISHVGVYVGNNEFAHASRSVGVTVSGLAEAYWSNRYQGARRILDAAGDEVFLPETAYPPDTPEVFATAASPRRTSSAPTFTKASVGERTASARRVGW